MRREHGVAADGRLRGVRRDLRLAFGASDPNEGSGLPVPRFVSLKSDHVNVRGGPNKDHDVAWVYTRPGLPVEITAEYENWRRIRDFGRRRRLGLPFAAVGQAHRVRHQIEDFGRAGRTP